MAKIFPVGVVFLYDLKKNIVYFATQDYYWMKHGIFKVI